MQVLMHLVLTVGLVSALASNLGQQRLRAQSPATPLQWELGPTGSPASLRGLSVAKDESIWACGSGATVLRSTDGGSSWIECGPRNFDSLEFRSLHAFDSEVACIASAGTPAVILRTEDGGQSWLEVYRNPSPAAFFNALRFWDERNGLLVGDPVGGRLMVVESLDGGRNWRRVEPSLLPVSLEGEASFAASNSCLEIAENGRVWIGTGGTRRESSRIYTRPSWSAKWTVSDCPLPSDVTQGVFSLAFHRNRVVAVGGDYREQVKSNCTAAVKIHTEADWRHVEQPPKGFRSAVVYVPHGVVGIWLATGPAGTDWSSDGDTWSAFSPVGFHALAVGRSGVYAVGSEGRFGKLQSLPSASGSNP